MARRVYEYTDQDGNTFWSFQRLPMVLVGRRLTLGTRIGAHFQNFLSFIKEQATLDPEDLEEG